MLPDEAKKAIEAELADVKKRFDEFAEKREKLLEVRRSNLSEIDKELAIVSEELVRLQGSNRELNKVLGRDVDGNPLPVEVKQPEKKIPTKK